ncbi:MAG: hypothetical protein R3B07_01780 [Polyangiaceae bacterium]
MRMSSGGRAVLVPLLLVACGRVSDIGSGGTGGTGAQGGSVAASGGSENGGAPNGGASIGGNAGTHPGGTAGTAAGGAAGTGFAGSAGAGVAGVGGDAGAAGGGFIEEGFYISEYQLGTLDPSGTPSVSAWQYYGADIDGKTSTSASANHCRLQPGANPSVKQDGINGIDNSFGANVLPMLQGIEPSVAEELNARVAGGDSSVFVTGPSGFGQIISGSIARANTFSGSAAGEWWVSDVDYPGGNASCSIDGETLNDQVYVWSFGTWKLPLMIAGTELLVPIRQPALGGKSVNGVLSDMMLSGVIPAEELIEALRQVAGALDPSLCSGSTFDSIAQQVRAASDVRVDGTNGDPSLDCNGISIGIGLNFTGALIRGYTTTQPAPPACP